jgi:hypothetical protein
MRTPFLLLVTILLLATAGCQSISRPSATVTPSASIWTHPPKDPDKISTYPATPVQVLPYFPVEKEPAKAYHLLALQGKLYVDVSGYIRVDWTEDEHVLIIWPYGYSLKMAENANLWIADEQGQLIWRVGDTVNLGGGFAGADIAALRIGKPLPVGCEGPYFLAGPRWDRG